MNSFRPISSLEGQASAGSGNRLHSKPGPQQYNKTVVPQYNNVKTTAFSHTKELVDQVGEEAGVRKFESVKYNHADPELARLCAESHVGAEDRRMSIDTRNMFQNRKASAGGLSGGWSSQNDASMGSRSSDERRSDSEFSNRSLDSRNSSSMSSAGRSQISTLRLNTSGSMPAYRHRHGSGNSSRAGRDFATPWSDDADMSHSMMSLSVSASGSKEHMPLQPAKPAKLISPFDHTETLSVLHPTGVVTPKPRRAERKSTRDDRQFKGPRLTDANLDRHTKSDKVAGKPSYPRTRSSGRKSAFSATSSDCSYEQNL